MREIRNAYEISIGKPEGRDHSEDLCMDKRMILKWILGARSGRVWRGLIWLRIGADCCEHGNEPWAQWNPGNFFDQLSGYQLLEDDCSIELVWFHLAIYNYLVISQSTKPLLFLSATNVAGSLQNSDCLLRLEVRENLAL
jgi:hypothetical protein